MKDTTEVGELLVSLCYLPAVERLTVTIIKARNLKPMDLNGSSGTNFYYKCDIKCIKLLMSLFNFFCEYRYGGFLCIKCV